MSSRATAEVGLDADRAIARALVGLQSHAPFFGALALFLERIADPDLPTAATDGKALFYNPRFVAGLDPRRTAGLLLHELLHAALEHTTRRGSRDPMRWNVAADIVVNGIVADVSWAELPEGAIRDRDHEDLSVEEVYELLPADVALAPELVDLVERDVLDAGSMGAFWRVARARASTLARAAGLFGSEPWGLRREIAALDAGGFDWRSALWRFAVRTPDDYGELDLRSVHRGLYLESLGIDRTALSVCVDTSGSIDDRTLAAFLGEVRSISRLYPSLSSALYYADAELFGPFPIDVDPPPARGGGGTDFRPFFEEIEKRGSRTGEPPGVAVYLTDGEGQFPRHRPRCPVMWAVTPGGVRETDFPFGEVVRLGGGFRSEEHP